MLLDNTNIFVSQSCEGDAQGHYYKSLSSRFSIFEALDISIGDAPDVPRCQYVIFCIEVYCIMGHFLMLSDLTQNGNVPRGNVMKISS